MPQENQDWDEFLKDSSAIIRTDDKLMAATADLLENPFDHETRTQMIGLLTSTEFSDASEAADRLSGHHRVVGQP